MNKYIEIIKELENKNIDMLGLEIVYELKCQLDYNKRVFNEDEKEKLFSIIEKAYIKSDDLNIETITHKAIELYDDLDNMSIWDFIDECIY